MWIARTPARTLNSALIVTVLCCTASAQTPAPTATPAQSSGKVTIDSPRGGWRNSAGAREEYSQSVNYPASSVNLQSGQSETAQIRGRIAGASKGAAASTASTASTAAASTAPDAAPGATAPNNEGANNDGARATRRRPARLIVNGAAMPIELDETGRYARPYSFGRGSNSVEVRSPDGKSRARTQFYDSYGSKTQSRLRVVLSWDTPGTDLDLHVVAPDGGHAWYGNRVMPNGGALDVDVTTGYGPEIFSSAAPARGNYHVYVNYFGSGQDTSMITVAQVAIITNENTTSERQQVFQVPMRAAGELTLVKSFVYP